MFLENQDAGSIEEYKRSLQSIGSLSKLFSESSIPYLVSRATENIFCKCLEADNLSRSDCSADAAKDRIGIGIKTFLNGNGKTLQKVAEFNKDMELYNGKSAEEVIEIISNLRNERIEATKRIHGLDEIIYHCIVREEKKIKIYECPMDTINLKSIKNIKCKGNTISFNDDKNEYSINISKSTLYKRFFTKNVLLELDIEIIEDPYDLLSKLLSNKHKLTFEKINLEKEHIFLPLYSDKGKRHVPERSGLNQWNANGRARNCNEVYIPIPSIIYKIAPNFFPGRDKPFTLILPDGNLLSAKVCQDGGKALMSNPNLDLGKWILRQVMNLEEKELLTYNRLEELGIDSVVIYKERKEVYSINFTELGSFDKFLDNCTY